MSINIEDAPPKSISRRTLSEGSITDSRISARDSRELFSSSLRESFSRSSGRNISHGPAILRSSNPCIQHRMLYSATKKYTLALDLDECSVVGGDTNDTLRTALTIKNHYAKTLPEAEAKSYAIDADRKLVNLGMLLVNPKLIESINKIRAKIGYTPYVLCYTNKGKLAEYISTLLDMLENRYNFTIENSTVSEAIKKQLNEERVNGWSKVKTTDPESGFYCFLEGSGPEEGYSYLMNMFKNRTIGHIMNLPSRLSFHDERINKLFQYLQMEFDKLSIVSYAISKSLELPYNALVVVGNLKYKDLTTFSPVLGASSFEKVFLYDDKSHEHYSNMRLYKGGFAKTAVDHGISGPEGINMLSVEPYDNHLMPPQNRAMIARLLSEMELDSTFAAQNRSLINDISTASTSWPKRRLLYNSETGKYEMGAGSLPYTDDSYTRATPWPVSQFTEPGFDNTHMRSMSGL
jgi:hypothetical protein